MFTLHSTELLEWWIQLYLNKDIFGFIFISMSYVLVMVYFFSDNFLPVIANIGVAATKQICRLSVFSIVVLALLFFFQFLCVKQNCVCVCYQSG